MQVEHYQIVPGNNGDSNVKLLLSPFEGVVYNYGDIRSSVVDGEPFFTYCFEIVDPGKHTIPSSVFESSQFKLLVNDILAEILLNSVPKVFR